MTFVAVAVIAAIVALAAFGVFAVRYARRPERRAESDWTDAAGREFAGLSASARCDLVFAVAALDDARSQDLLERALEDPSEPVALAAAHALARRGRHASVERYLTQHPGVRADRIAAMLALLGAEP
ncbi:MAG: hypothetical protein WB615_01305 [Candidatus Tumulicola sp.]